MQNHDGTTHPATFQPDLCEQLTSATVIMWIRRRAAAAMGRTDMISAQALAIAAATVERHTMPTQGGECPACRGVHCPGHGTM